MNLLNRFFGRKNKTKYPVDSGNGNKQEMPDGQDSSIPDHQEMNAEEQPNLSGEEKSKTVKETSGLSTSKKRTVRVFVSSTFRDMVEDRNELMTYTWTELRKFCRERQVEFVEVDLRWGIAEEQSTRRETLKLCLDEIHASRPYFIGLLGERYGWVPGDDAFTADLEEEQSWLKGLHGKSVTELEIIHGVLNDPEMEERAFFYLRSPEYAKEKGADFLPEDEKSKVRQTTLKELIRKTCSEKNIPLHETYSDPHELALLVLEQLKSAIDVQFPKEEIPDPLDHEALGHEAFAEIRRRTYIGRPDYFKALDNHCNNDGMPLLLQGDSGSGKSALLANLVEHRRKEHPDDFIFQHYIGGTADSSVHWKIMSRLMSEIKRWTEDNDEIPKTNDNILRDFPLWLSKARIRAEQKGVKFIVILDALNQLEDKDHAHTLGWLPVEPFRGSLRLIVSTLPGALLEELEKRSLPVLRIESLTPDERGRMIVDYLKRFGKSLDKKRIERISNNKAAANPLYLKILLDELRVTGTHAKLDERLNDYLRSEDIPSLLRNVLERYQRDYEDDHKGLVNRALGLICCARRGLSESELLQLLRPDNLPQLPVAIWSPLRAALDESLVDRGGILNFAHDFLRSAVETAYVPEKNKKNDFRIQLSDYFEALPPSARSCDELPLLLHQTRLLDRLRSCLLNIDCFLEILKRDEDELRGYWVDLGEEKNMGQSYLDSFNQWKAAKTDDRISYCANALGFFLNSVALHSEAEPLYLLSLEIEENRYGRDHPEVAIRLNNLAQLLQATNRMEEAEPLMRRALEIHERSFGKDHPNVAISLNNLAVLLQNTNRLKGAEPLMKSALEIDERSFGKEHPNIAIRLNNLAGLLQDTNRMEEAEPLMKRALEIDERSFGQDHPRVASSLNNLAQLLKYTNRMAEAEPLMRRALEIDESSYGKEHPNVAIRLNNLAQLLKDTNRLKEAEPLMRRALEIDERSYGKDHPNVATSLINLAGLLKDTNRMGEAEPLMGRALEIDERSFGKNHPNVAISLNNLAQLLKDTNRLKEAEPLMRRALEIDERSFGKEHPNVAISLNVLAQLLKDTNRMEEAEPLMRRALEINERSFGKDHPNVACDLNNLALLLKDTNRQKEAEPLMKRALEIVEKSFGKDHPNVATSLNNLALLLKDTNRLKEAEPLMRKALESNERSYGKDHPEVATCLNNLALLLKATNRLEEAEPLMKRALKIVEKSFGKDHPNVATSLNNLAQLLKDTNRLKEAEPLMRIALEIDERSFGKEHPNVACNLNNLALLLTATNRLKEAEPLMRRALEVLINSTSISGHSHPDLNLFTNNYIKLLRACSRNDQQIDEQLRKMGLKT